MTKRLGGRLLQAGVWWRDESFQALYSLFVDTQRQIPAWAYKLLLVAAAAMWGGSFVVLKNSLDTMAPSWVLVFRFAFATLILAVVFFGRLRAHFDVGYLLPGVWLGLSYGGGYVLQTYGLAQTTPGINAFLTAPYCVLVPYMVWAGGGKRPSAFSVIAAVLAVAGIGFISLGNDLSFSLGPGEWLSLGCSVMYALHMVLVPLVAKGKDMMCMTIAQLAVCFVVALVFAVALDEPPTPEVFTPDFIGALAYLVLFASCFSMTAQNVGLGHVNPSSAALILSLESVFAVICSVIFYGEKITLHLALGFTLIFVAIVVSEVIAPLGGERDGNPIKA